MSVESDARPLFEALQSRHRAIQVLGVLLCVLGLAVATYVGFEWFLRGTSHEILAVVAAGSILLGVQLLVLSTLTGMLIVLHREQLDRFE